MPWRYSTAKVAKRLFSALMSYETINLEIDGALATLTLNRPAAANSMNNEMSAELRDAAIRLSHNRSVRAVLLTANGRVFCGGGDLAGFAKGGPAELPVTVESMTVDLHAAINRFSRLDAPLVAAVSGSVGGAGMSLVAACDLVVAGESSKFTMGYTRAGLSPDGTSSFFLARVVGLRRALDLVLTNRLLSAKEAEEWGLVNRVVPDDEVRMHAETLARQLAAGPTRAFGLAKRLMLDGATSSLEQAMERESFAIAEAAGTADAQEGIRAFLEKRSAAFSGQ